MRSGGREADRFVEWLALELAPTLSGNKPATVLTFRDSTYQAALTLWRQYDYFAFGGTLLRFLTLRGDADVETVLFYRTDALSRCIANAEHRRFLQELGYPVDAGVDACLALLRQRFSQSCPHEVGVLLGIPLKDVLGFMAKSDLPLTCRKEWCVYGNPDSSLAAMGRFADDKALVSCLIAGGMSPYIILQGGSGFWSNSA
ncbi:MAG: DUF3793 family protein [Sporomusaceae bacterium]|nr:DUF3793 family protein [Sporomusaceae bacterium]